VETKIILSSKEREINSGTELPTSLAAAITVLLQRQSGYISKCRERAYTGAHASSAYTTVKIC